MSNTVSHLSRRSLVPVFVFVFLFAFLYLFLSLYLLFYLFPPTSVIASLVFLAGAGVQHSVPSLEEELVPVFCIICMRSLLVHTGEAGHLSPLHLASVIVVVLVIVLHIIHLYPLPTSVISNVIIVFFYCFCHCYLFAWYAPGQH